LYIVAQREASTTLKQGLLEAFSKFDRDQNGYVDAEEIKEAMMVLGEEPFTEEEWVKLLEEYEMPPDNQIDYYQFVDIMTRKEPAQ